jgi:hypothetical protein
MYVYVALQERQGTLITLRLKIYVALKNCQGTLATLRLKK